MKERITNCGNRKKGGCSWAGSADGKTSHLVVLKATRKTLSNVQQKAA